MRSVIERAVQVAPECSSITELKKRLSAEGYQELGTHLGGLGTQRQLRALFKKPGRVLCPYGDMIESLPLGKLTGAVGSEPGRALCRALPGFPASSCA